ncbi:MAG: hypothetical protein JWN96_947 [Mycobacterium sp.]|nr:hypothetical protein [Mycobacterium sp.]
MTEIHQFLSRLDNSPGETFIGFPLIALTAAGLLGAKHLVESMNRTFAFDVVLLGSTLLWWLSNRRLEGRTLVSFTPDHGFTLGDLLGVPAVVLAAGLFIAAWRHRPAAAARLGKLRR